VALKIEAELARAMQSRIARVAVGPSTVRGYPAVLLMPLDDFYAAFRFGAAQWPMRRASQPSWIAPHVGLWLSFPAGHAAGVWRASF